MPIPPRLRPARSCAFGRVLLAGETLEDRLAFSAGTLDPTFNGTGLALVHPGANGFANEGYNIATQADGKVVLAGTAWNSNNQNSFALVRYNANGSLDTTFGTGGQAVNPISTASEQEQLFGLIVEPDQKIVVSGEVGLNMVVARYNTNGSLDSTFGTGGVVTVPAVGQDFVNGVGESLAVQADGKYIITGQSIQLQFKNTWPVLRLNHDGSVDTSFGAAGLATGPIFPSVSGLADAWDVIVQQDQKIVVAGDTEGDQWVIARYNSNGTLDGTFGTNGVATVTFTSTNETPFQVVEQADGKLLIAGNPFANGIEAQQGFQLVRLNANGTPDSTFNGGQPIVTGAPGQQDSLSFGMAVQADGKILLGGGITASAGSGIGNFAVQRYNANGTLDTTYGNAGTAVSTFDDTASNWGLSHSDTRVGMAMEPNGSIVMMSPGLITLLDNPTSWIVARFTGDSVALPVPTVTVSDAGGVYNGGPFPATATVNGSSSLEGVSPTLAYYVGSTATGTASSTAPTAAGTYTVVANFAGSSDFAAASSSAVTFSIAKANPSVGVSDTGGSFTGNPYGAAATVNGAASLEGISPTLAYYVGSVVSGTPSSTAPSVVGTYTVLATFAGSANYSAAFSGPVTFSIVKSVPSVTVSDAGGAHNGNPFPATALVNGAETLEGVSPTVSYYVGTTATGVPSSTAPSALGTYTVVANFPGSSDFTAASSSPVTFSISQAFLGVSITPVTPSPRTTSVSSMTITFTEPVTGFSLSNLQLSLNGGANLLTAAQTLTTSDNLTWILGNLSGLTGKVGNYMLTLSPSGIQNTDGIALANGASSGFTFSSQGQNKVNPLDANNDGLVSPIDALVVINYLDSQGVGTFAGDFLDVNGDGTITPLDALNIINYLDTPVTPNVVAADPAIVSGGQNSAAPAAVATINGSLAMGVSLSTGSQPAVLSSNATASLTTSGPQIGSTFGAVASTAGLNQAASNSLPTAANRSKSQPAVQSAAVDAVLSEPLLEW